MTVKEIVKNHLQAYGFDGLINCDVECGCDLDDLFPCDTVDEECVPGYKKPDTTSESGWTMTRQKPKEKKT